MLTSALLLQHEKFQSAPGSRVGTPAYLAPEVIMTTKGQTYDGKVLTCCCHHCCCSCSCNNWLRLGNFAERLRSLCGLKSRLHSMAQRNAGSVAACQAMPIPYSVLIEANFQEILGGAECSSVLLGANAMTYCVLLPVIATQLHVLCPTACQLA